MKPTEEEIFKKQIEMIGDRFISEVGMECILKVLGLEIGQITTSLDLGCYLMEYMPNTCDLMEGEIQSDLQKWIERESETDDRDDVSVDDPANYLKREL